MRKGSMNELKHNSSYEARWKLNTTLSMNRVVGQVIGIL